MIFYVSKWSFLDIGSKRHSADFYALWMERHIYCSVRPATVYLVRGWTFSFLFLEARAFLVVCHTWLMVTPCDVYSYEIQRIEKVVRIANFKSVPNINFYKILIFDKIFQLLTKFLIFWQKFLILPNFNFLIEVSIFWTKLFNFWTKFTIFWSMIAIF